MTDTTLLRSLYLIPLPEIGNVRVMSIDDWAWRKGQSYGSILVNLETHKIRDLLPQRTVESVIAWFESHPEIERVSRDRGGTYGDGATRGAPLAVQICDRWHLMVRRIGACVDSFQRKEGLRAKDP